MPKLAKLEGSEWQIVAAEGSYQSLEDWDGSSALNLSCDVEGEARFADASAISIEFPAFNDGRALSLAVLLRTRYGFSGPLRATGATHEDIVHYMVRCGFDEIEIPDDRNSDRFLELMAPYSEHYQGSVSTPTPSYSRVSRGVNA